MHAPLVPLELTYSSGQSKEILPMSHDLPGFIVTSSSKSPQNKTEERNNL